VQCTQTIMRSPEDKAALAREVLSVVATGPRASHPTPHGVAFRRLDQQP
jgi:hypothetical protein